MVNQDEVKGGVGVDTTGVSVGLESCNTETHKVKAEKFWDNFTNVVNADFIDQGIDPFAQFLPCSPLNAKLGNQCLFTPQALEFKWRDVNSMTDYFG